jgi:hypothetical protein
VASEEELEKVAPKLYQKLKGIREEAFREATLGLPKWFEDKQAREKAATEAKTNLEKHFSQLAETAKSNWSELKAKDPEVNDKFNRTGITDVLKSISDKYKINFNEFAADKKLMDVLYKAAYAMDRVDREPEMRKAIEKNYETNLAKTKTAEKVSLSEPMPNDRAEISRRMFEMQHANK